MWQIPPRVSQAVLKVVGKQNGRRLLPKLRLLLFDVLGHVCLALPMVDMVEPSLGKLHRIREGAPDEVLQRRDLGSSIGQSLALGDLDDFGSRSPEVSQGEDDAGSGKDLFQCLWAVVEVCSLDIYPLCRELQSSGLGDITRETLDTILVGILEKFFNDRSSLTQSQVRCQMDVSGWGSEIQTCKPVAPTTTTVLGDILS